MAATEQKSGNGRIVGYVAIVIAIVALVLSLANMGVKGTVEELKKETKVIKEQERILEAKAKRLCFLQTVDRIYELTMIDRDYATAKIELAKAEKVFAEIKENMSSEDAKKIEALLASLKAEVNRGPSPIPKIVSEIRSTLTAAHLVSKKAPEAEKAEAKPSLKKAEKLQKPVVKTGAAKQPEVSAEESSLKKVYEFWSSIGKKLVKKQ